MDFDSDGRYFNHNENVLMIMNANPQNLVSESGFSSGDKIALGIGIGIGVPALIAIIVGSYYAYRVYAENRRKRALERSEDERRGAGEQTGTSQQGGNAEQILNSQE